MIGRIVEHSTRIISYLYTLISIYTLLYTLAHILIRISHTHILITIYSYVYPITIFP